MINALLAWFRRLEASAALDGSIESMSDKQLFTAYKDLIERAGGAEAYAAALRAEGTDRPADDVLRCAACQTAAEFLALAR